jgi:hypothetical protein
VHLPISYVTAGYVGRFSGFFTSAGIWLDTDEIAVNEQHAVFVISVNLPDNWRELVAVRTAVIFVFNDDDPGIGWPNVMIRDLAITDVGCGQQFRFIQIRYHSVNIVAR